MTAYWVSTYFEITDPDKMAAYAALARPALEAGGGEFLTRGTAVAAWEAGTLQRTVIIAFPDADTAIAAHDSEAYQHALAALDGGAHRDIRIIPGD